jgi:hypothetical protein
VSGRMSFGGPAFQPSEDDSRKSIFGKQGGHYNIYGTKPGMQMKLLREFFPDGEANEMNLVLFSTSGAHGTYITIEEVEESCQKYGFDHETAEEDEDAAWPDDRVGTDVTFLLIQPRIVSVTYGNVFVKSQADIEFLKKLRASSWGWFQKIGRPP